MRSTSWCFCGSNFSISSLQLTQSRMSAPIRVVSAQEGTSNRGKFLLLALVCVVGGIIYYLCSYSALFEQGRGTVKATKNGPESHNGTDLFDLCPYEAPDPWDKSIVKFMDVKYGYLKDCKVKESAVPVTEMQNRTVVIKEDKKNFKCKARCLFYFNDTYYKGSKWIWTDDAVFNCEFVETYCISSEQEVNRYIHTQFVETKSDEKTKLDPQKHQDVLLMVLDSVASTQIIRGLPRTINFLTKGMGAVEFLKFNRVGANSRPNAFPMLYGKTLEIVTRKAFNLPSVEPDWSYDYSCNRYIDNETLILLEYQDAGYKVFDGEDYSASIVFYPKCSGITRKFHHSYRPFYTRIYEDDDLYNIHTSHSCRLIHNTLLDYLGLFLNAYEGLAKFSFAWLTDLAHDSTEYLYRSDYDLYDFFLKHRERLANTFIFFMGDHGPRFGSEAYTEFGSRETNNPFLYVVLPQHLRKSEMHQQLMKNSKELITHHDMHSTLKDILYFQPKSNFTDLKFKRFDSNPRGSSLLREFEPGVRRTCKTLPIPFQYCICQYPKVIITENEKVLALGKFAAAGIESILESYNVTSECEKITMYKVFIVHEYEPDNIRDIEYHFYEIIFSLALPAYGKFKTQIREDKHGKFERAGDYYERLDKYDNKGDCMENEQLKILCTCKAFTTMTAQPSSSLPISSRPLSRETSQSEFISETKRLSSQLESKLEPILLDYPSETSLDPGKTSKSEFGNSTERHSERSTRSSDA